LNHHPTPQIKNKHKKFVVIIITREKSNKKVPSNDDDDDDDADGLLALRASPFQQVGLQKSKITKTWM
jgi:hypothetical protein